MDFRITGISPQPFRPLFDLNDDALHQLGAHRVFADDDSFPCRVSVAHAAQGEELLLVNYEHQPAPHSPYRAAGPIFVRKLAMETFDAINLIPEPVRARLLSVRAYDADDLIVEADVSDGSAIEPLIEQFLRRDDVAYLHIHYARRGCYACRVDRVQAAEASKS